MSVRWKFLIFFMTFSLAPLLVVTLVGQRGIVRMGETISDFAKKSRTEIVSRELKQTARDYAKILGREKEILELTLRIIARERGWMVWLQLKTVTSSVKSDWM